MERENIQKSLNNAALVSITDLEGNILKVNEKICQVTKYNESELIGKNHNIVNSGHHPKEFWAEMWKTIKAGQSWRADVKNMAKDGSFYWLDTVITPVRNSAGEIYAFMSIRYEITERKNLEEKLQRQNKILSDIAWQQSHEVRKPVANILGMCNLIKDDITASEEDKKLYIDHLCKATQELDLIIHKIVAKTYETR